MGANAATKLYRIMDNLEHILSIELMNAAQGIEFRRPIKDLSRFGTLPERISQRSPFY